MVRRRCKSSEFWHGSQLSDCFEARDAIEESAVFVNNVA